MIWVIEAGTKLWITFSSVLNDCQWPKLFSRAKDFPRRKAPDPAPSPTIPIKSTWIFFSWREVDPSTRMCWMSRTFFHFAWTFVYRSRKSYDCSKSTLGKWNDKLWFSAPSSLIPRTGFRVLRRQAALQTCFHAEILDDLYIISKVINRQNKILPRPSITCFWHPWRRENKMIGRTT